MMLILTEPLYFISWFTTNTQALFTFYLGDLVRLNFDDPFLGIVPRSLFAVLCPLPDRFVRGTSEINLNLNINHLLVNT